VSRAPSFRIVRELRNGARRDVAHPLMPGTDGLSLHAPDADTAVRNAKTLGITGNLIAIPEAN
jgi:hypothetical protein